jgi:hypothetical protein
MCLPTYVYGLEIVEFTILFSSQIFLPFSHYKTLKREAKVNSCNNVAFTEKNIEIF